MQTREQDALASHLRLRDRLLVAGAGAIAAGAIAALLLSWFARSRHARARI